MKKVSLTKNKRGQVFLLLSITILIFLIIISATIFQITQSPYINPAPNQQQMFDYLDNGLNAIDDLSNVALSQLSLGASRDDVLTIMDEGLVQIEAYLDDHNLQSILTYDDVNLIIANSSTSINPVYIHFEVEVSIHINSLDLFYESVIHLNTTYYMETSGIVGNLNYVYLYKEANGVKTMVSDGIVAISPSTSVTNLGDGRYSADLAAGQMITALLPHNIWLWLEI